MVTAFVGTVLYWYAQAQSATIALPQSVWTIAVPAFVSGLISFISFRTAVHYRLVGLERENKDMQSGLAKELSRLSNRLDSMDRTLHEVELHLERAKGREEERDRTHDRERAEDRER